MKNFITFMCVLMLCFAMPTEIKSFNNVVLEDNWWSMLYPDIGTMSDNMENVEIKLKIAEIFERN